MPEQGGSPARRRRKPVPEEPFKLWFFRLVQVFGVVIVLHEIFLRSEFRLDVAGVGMAMMTGALGVERLVQWYVKR